VGMIGDRAVHIPARDDVGHWLFSEARDGDRIVIMGARDDTLSAFARSIVERLPG
jgi:UDP-N-acetylmuramate--alanine ligase